MDNGLCHLGSDDSLDLSAIAKIRVCEADDLCTDLMAVLFPHGTALPSEQLQATVSAKLFRLVTSLERAILLDVQSAKCWALMSKSGLLREKRLIEFALARVAEDNLIQHLALRGAQSQLSEMPVILLQDTDRVIAQLAQKLWAAEQRRQNPDQFLYQELEPQDLHLLAWKVVATCFGDDHDQNAILEARVHTILEAHDDSGRVLKAAQKLLFALGDRAHLHAVSPNTHGLHLFAAALSLQIKPE